MFYIIWAIINILLYALFLGSIIKLSRLLKDKLGLFTTIILIVGLVLTISGTSQKSKMNNSVVNETGKFKFNSLDSVHKNSLIDKNIVLEKTPFATYDLKVQFGKNKTTNKFIPIFAYSSPIGVFIGTTYTPLTIRIRDNNNDEVYEYDVNSVIEWKLFGATINYKYKMYSGKFTVKQ